MRARKMLSGRNISRQSANGTAVGPSERVSEINLIDVRDVRAQLAGNDSQIEVRLGGQELGQRLKIMLGELDAHKQLRADRLSPMLIGRVAGW